jgi:hypothetical protein
MALHFASQFFAGKLTTRSVSPKAMPRGRSIVNIAEDVRKSAAEQALSEEEALKQGLEEKAEKYRRPGAGGIDQPQAGPKGEDAGKHPSQFVEQGAEVYARLRAANTLA